MQSRCEQDYAQSKFCLKQIQTTPQIRNILDEIATEGLFRVFITPQDGSEKQDCEVAAAKRSIGNYASEFKGQPQIAFGG